MTQRKLFSQGDLDGACFLYTLANAVVALTGANLKDRWPGAIQQVPKPEVFLRFDVGTAAFEDDFSTLLPVAESFVSAICRDVSVEIVSGVDRRRLSQIADGDTVLAMCNPEHWFAIVEADEKHAWVACSARLLECGADYREFNSPRWKRPSNHKVAIEDLAVYRRTVFRLHRSLVSGVVPRK
ncbi:hypothetical protein JY96_11220 [Aquabacterium sp. NJ1]|uniref:hypothetical protein n=1 Tax=Aquabacterium sp. NJ1 TaxID=1538295 RepID=UPI00052CA844|nr:hypothetical protein [Aquabacterium sp. NJ1]KGM40411.1 hypothetical protein JY96_11220 [Aquabacterium sp. NJ1]